MRSEGVRSLTLPVGAPHSDGMKTTLSSLLVIGYGSTLRGDDAAGFRLAEELSAEEGISTMPVHQLTPDLAAAIAEAEEVVFVDAEFGDYVNGLQIHLLLPGGKGSASSHGCSPSALLDLADRLYGRRPVATVIGIPARDAGLSEQVSAITRTGIEDAKRWILERWACHA